MSSAAENLTAVCSWSLEPESIDDLIGKVRACGLHAVQLALMPLLEAPAKWADTGAKLRDNGIAIVSGMMSCVGEDYSTIARIKTTGGVMPDATYPATLQNMRQAAPLAQKLGIQLITFHAGFIPIEPASAEFQKALLRVTEMASICSNCGIDVALETGQEPADALNEFLSALKITNVGVNFDPANMLLYGSGDPLPALQSLLPHVKQVHIKDALASKTPGEWGVELPAGNGQVEWPTFFQLLRDKHINFVVEREAGNSRSEDVITARNLIERFHSSAMI